MPLKVDEWQALVYIAGYVGRKKKFDNEKDNYFYYEKYGTFTQNLSRDGLSIVFSAALSLKYNKFAMIFITLGQHESGK